MRILINDTKDLRVDFGTVALQNHLKAVVTPPVLKQFKKTDWTDENGTDYDVSNPVFEARSLSIPFYSNSEYDYRKLTAYLEANIKNKWYFEAIDRAYILRLTGNSSVSQSMDKYWFTLTFSEDKPMEDFQENLLRAEVFEATGYTVDDIDFGSFGICFLKGYIQELNKPFPVRENLKIQSANISGLEYPNTDTCYLPMTVKLPAIFKGASKLARLENFVWFLTRPGYRTFFDTQTRQDFPFIYKNIEVVEITSNEWLKVNINLELQGNVYDVLVDVLNNYLVDADNKTLTQIL